MVERKPAEGKLVLPHETRSGPGRHHMQIEAVPAVVLKAAVETLDHQDVDRNLCLALWAAVKAPGIRLKLHKGEEFHTGTYFAYRDKIINAYDPKSINQIYEGSHHFLSALNALTSRTASGREAAH